MEALRTRAEATDYQQTSRHADVTSFVDRLTTLTPLAHKLSLGPSGEGQDMVALVLSDRRAFDPERARKQKKPVVLVEANIHAGEVEGKEAALALARDLTLGKRHREILERVCLVIIPDFNPDGNDRISPANRRLRLEHLEGQVNPAGGVGTRYTGEGWNLNRDAMKQEAIETRNLGRFFQAWWPELFIDCHTTDGSIHTYDLTFDTSHGNDALFAELRTFNRRMLEKVARNVEKRHGFTSQWYGNFPVEDDPSSGWQTYPALPRFGSHYRGLLGRLDVLLETYSYIDFPRRCAVMRAWLLELWRFAAKHGPDLRRITAAEEARIIDRGQSLDPRPSLGINFGTAKRDSTGALLFDYPAHALDGDELEISSFDRESLKARQYPGQKKKRYVTPHLRSFVPTVVVSTPVAYLVPPSLAERLRGHGIEHTALEAEQEIEVESYRILHQEPTFSPDVAGLVPPPGEAEVPLSAKPPPKRFETVLTTRAERGARTFPAGTLYVPTAQRTGTLAVYLLEPSSDDGFARWQFLDPLVSGELFPVHRVVRAPALRPRPE